MHAGYRSLDGLTDSQLSLPCMREPDDMAIEYLGINVQKLYEFMMCTFSGGKSLGSRENGTLSSPMTNQAPDKLDHRDYDGEASWYKSKEKLFTDYFEKKMWS